MNGAVTPPDPTQAAPLSGLRVLDLCRVVSGPFGSLLLADLGAEVIRIESLPTHEPGAPELDPTKLSEDEAFNWGLSRNKHSVAINLKSDDGRALFYRLVAEADVVIDNFRPGVTQRLGIDRDAITQYNPTVITCSLTGFGGDGPWADDAGVRPDRAGDVRDDELHASRARAATRAVGDPDRGPVRRDLQRDWRAGGGDPPRSHGGRSARRRLDARRDARPQHLPRAAGPHLRAGAAPGAVRGRAGHRAVRQLRVQRRLGRDLHQPADVAGSLRGHGAPGPADRRAVQHRPCPARPSRRARRGAAGRVQAAQRRPLAGTPHGGRRRLREGHPGCRRLPPPAGARAPHVRRHHRRVRTHGDRRGRLAQVQ